MAAGIEFGLYTLGDVFAHPVTQQQQSDSERIHNIIEMAQLAEQAGFDIFQLGESHQKSFVSQAHLVILSAIAQATKSIRLSSGATIIGAADPVRIYEEAATIDIISNGRMELMCGRSARSGIFETLGYDIDEYERLFDEKYALLKLINSRHIVTWQGHYRNPLEQVAVLPRAVQENGLPIWRAIAGSESSARSAGEAGDAIAIIDFSGQLSAYKKIVECYRTAADNEGHAIEKAKVAFSGYLFTRKTTQEAIQQYYPHVKAGQLAAFGFPMEKEVFEKADQFDSLINVASPERLVEKILYQVETLGAQRYVGLIDFAGMPMDEIKKTIDLLATEVIPKVKHYTRK